MRVWSLHPRYLDPQGLVALWRETLLAQAVLRGLTKGYKNHPQLNRFKAHGAPISAVNAYLAAVHAEAVARGYNFDKSKTGPLRAVKGMSVTEGQVEHEWRHLLRKLSARSPALYEKWHRVRKPDIHPLFILKPGPVEDWEVVSP
jgi:hypothetical protein